MFQKPDLKSYTGAGSVMLLGPLWETLTAEIVPQDELHVT